MNIESLIGVTWATAASTLAAVATPPDTFDYQGVSFIIGAVGVFIGTIISSALAIGTFMRAGRAERRSIEMMARQDVLITSVDGVSTRLQAATAKASFAEGKEAGEDKVRAQQAVVPPVQSVIVEDVKPPAVEAIRAGTKPPA